MERGSQSGIKAPQHATAPCRWGHTALDEAMREQRRDVVAYLQERGAPADGRRKEA